MSLPLRHPNRLALLALVASFTLILGAAIPGQAGPGRGGSINTKRGLKSEAEEAGEGSDEILESAFSFAAVATAPAATVDSAAFVSAFTQAQALSVVGGPWTQLQNTNYNSDNRDYRDPVISNSGGGAGNVSGRMPGLAVMPGTGGSEVYAGGADGGVWKSTDGGAHWSPTFDHAAASIAIGAIAIDPATHAIWVGTGENNTAFENHKGVGVYRSTNHGGSWTQIGPNVTNSTIGDLEFDRQGRVYVATSRGLFSRSTSAAPGTNWSKEFDAETFGYEPIPYGLSIVNDVEVKPGTNGRVVVVNMAWRNGTEYNGFYVSRDAGATWAKVHTSGLNENEVGTASIDFASDGRLYAVIESTFLINHPAPQRGSTVLMGVFVSKSGDAGGPWKLLADWKELQDSGSALQYIGYAPGIQAWYNQFLGVDPSNPNHVYLGLEEVFETRDGGTTWRAIGPYWNFSLPCAANGLDSCPKTTHPDQHVVAFGGGRVWVGNDGGIYSRSLTRSMATPAGWNNLNATLRTLQYYGAGAGTAPADPGNPDIGSGPMVWGGMQDNGVSLLAPGLSEMVSPFGGDGGQQLVDPANGDRSISEYTSLDMWKTTNGGYAPANTPSDLSSINAWEEFTPSCFAFLYVPDPCDPLPRFIAPFTWDNDQIDHLVAAGEFVWYSDQGFDTECSATACDWEIVGDTGAGHSSTAVGISGDTIYAGWCAPGTGCNPAEGAIDPEDNPFGFNSGIVRVDLSTDPPTVTEVGEDDPVLPTRYVSAVAVDPSDPSGDHVYAAFGGFSRRWIDGGGVGHVFESSDGGQTWVDISGNLPDAPTRDLILTNSGDLVLATDVGVFVADAGDHDAWSQLGGNLPHSVVDDLSLYPGGGSILAGTHGRGLWSVPTPA
jgi:photosystem II stability/assembly factor-like uncharacterized protein